jgi:indole-3-glycerol phosphate synthase
LAVIAELKQASPSAGVIRMEEDLIGRIQAYARGGASALSILTEEHYFRGSPRILELARAQSPLPLLRKDFIVDPYQIEESRRLGADAILLIVRLFTVDDLKAFLAATESAGLEALEEVHSEDDLKKALQAQAATVGVNHRDLKTLEIDMSMSQKLLPRLGSARTRIVESGIQKPEDLLSFSALGAHAVLIGEALMREADADAAVRRYVQAGRVASRKST